MPLTFRTAVILFTLSMWLFYETRIHSYCWAHVSSLDQPAISVSESAACGQSHEDFSKFGLNCAEARLSLDSRVRERKVWKCHASEHILFGSWLRIFCTAGLLGWLAVAFYGKEQDRKAKVEMQKETLKTLGRMNGSILSNDTEYEHVRFPRVRSRSRIQLLQGTAQIEELPPDC
jgi:hypothetical protein